ncbi:hypothetical protein DUI87_17999 [Hirundo rustica rustica]|uniref:Uncharacterized protein n=1 Tax=Hirundo rustica rustica TaxID=333673 RepID=A0A3M0JUZ7_HIRRU|nr:hypothetical protein DUI87_17999 [Hirundo rustica rustica]
MLKLEIVQSNQNVTALPANGAARPNSTGLTQVVDILEVEGNPVEYNPRIQFSYLRAGRALYPVYLYLVLPSNCTRKVNGKALLLDQAVTPHNIHASQGQDFKRICIIPNYILNFVNSWV